MFVSIHIPKTAGTALAKLFDDTSGGRVMYDYGTEWDIEAARTCPAEVREHGSLIQDKYKYLHGHFHYLKYADVFPDAPVITTVRHPVDRVVSQYLHVLRGGDRNLWQHRAVMDGEMSIVEFAKQKYIGNAQWYYLEGREIEDYDFILVQEHMKLSLAKFCKRFNLPEVRKYLAQSGGLPRVNEKPVLSQKVREVQITEDDKRKIFNICKRDVDVYRRAVECLKAA